MLFHSVAVVNFEVPQELCAVLLFATASSDYVFNRIGWIAWNGPIAKVIVSATAITSCGIRNGDFIL